MATNPHRHLHNGEARGLAARWLIAGVGLIWLLRSALRTKRHHFATPAAVELSDQRPADLKPHRGHEQRDAHVGWIFGIVAFLFISGLCIHFILAGLLGALKRSPPPTDRWRPAKQAQRPAPPAGSFPVLQLSPPGDLQAFRAREDAEMNTYGWVNQTARVVRVPIERAMDLVLQQGLPVRVGTNANQAGPSPAQLIEQRLNHREPEILRR